MSAPRSPINASHQRRVSPTQGPSQKERAEATAQLLGRAAPALSAESQALVPLAESKPRPNVKVTGLPAPAAPAPDPYDAINKANYIRRPLKPLPPGSVVLSQEGFERVKRMIATHPDVIAAREENQ